MRFTSIFAALAVLSGVSTAALAEGMPLMSETAPEGTMIVVDGEAFYDPSVAAAFDDGGQAFSNGWAPQPTVSYSAEGTVTSEMIDGTVFETVTDHSGRVVQGRRVVPTY